MPLIILAGTMLVITLLVLKPSAPPKKPALDLLPLVQTLPAAPQAHRPTVTLYGRLESPRESNLSSTINAYVARVLVEEGHWVRAGDIIVELEDSDVRLIYQQRQAELEDLEAQLASEQARYQTDIKALEVEQELVALSQKSAARYEKLVERNVGSDLNRDEALQQARAQALSLYNREYAVADHPNRLKRLQAQLARAQAVRDQAALDLARTRITAPFDGRVTAINASPGNRVRPGDVLASLFDAAHVEVRAQIPSRYLNQVEAALQQGIELDAVFALNDKRVALRLERLAGAIGLGQGGVDGLFALQQPDRNLTLGRAGEVYLHMPPIADSIALPPTALYGQQRIYAVREGLLHTIMIQRLGEVLQANGERWQLVQAAVEPGEPILITQLSNAVGGLRVKLDTATAEPAAESSSHE
ncbi:efflux RND transporter periplasmic adaptor subunit [Ketobacter sp.]|uniref:efflux RND transporter periplasmic adaptor subunit n=1 Tax=Ketobacter sp. TaxID=2083498 RepID=UPI0025C17E44|nr:HlyD family efflux transporter periplasmic adaptor subunit [Ketobacter sp.]